VTGYYEAPSRLRPAPDLRVVPLDTIWVHEDPDPSRFVALRDAIGKQGVLENPVVVGSVTAAAADRHRFVHLDGANRIAALRALGCTQVVVQVVDVHQPQQVRLSTWAHRTWVDPVDFLRHLQRLPEVDLQPLSRVGDATEDRAAAAFIFCKQGAYQLCLQKPTVTSRIAALHAAVSLYSGRIERYQLPLWPEPHIVARHLATGALDEPHHVLITFVPLQAADFSELASRGVRVPPGVTRFVLRGGRAMGVNAPLSILGPNGRAASADNWLATVRKEQPVIMPGPCRVREFLGWREYDDDEPLLLYHQNRDLSQCAIRDRGTQGRQDRHGGARHVGLWPPDLISGHPRTP
jgi:L-serine kinase (ATP) / ParB family transcriptional regulator, heme-responsive regulator